MDRITWPVVTLVVSILASVTILGLARVDTAAITNVLILIGLGGGLGVLTGIKTNVNGNLSQMLNALRSAMDSLAKSQPVNNDDNGKDE